MAYLIIKTIKNTEFSELFRCDKFIYGRVFNFVKTILWSEAVDSGTHASSGNIPRDQTKSIRSKGLIAGEVFGAGMIPSTVKGSTKPAAMTSCVTGLPGTELKSPPNTAGVRLPI